MLTHRFSHHCRMGFLYELCSMMFGTMTQYHQLMYPFKPIVMTFVFCDILLTVKRLSYRCFSRLWVVFYTCGMYGLWILLNILQDTIVHMFVCSIGLPGISFAAGVLVWASQSALSFFPDGNDSFLYGGLFGSGSLWNTPLVFHKDPESNVSLNWI